jgi:hypothetical protein
MTDILSGLAGLMATLDGWATAVPATLDDRFGVLAPAVAGAAAAPAVAIVAAIYFRGRYRSSRDILRHGMAAMVVLGLLALVASDMRHAALAYLGLNSSMPAVEFEIDLPKTTALVVASETQVELRRLM